MKLKIDTNELRLVAGVMVIIICIFYMYKGVQNTQIENILYMLVAFVIGGALLNNQNNKNE